MLELFQFEQCPYCQKVREKMTELDLDYICRNVPKGSETRNLLIEIGGKEQVPFLVDTTDPSDVIMMYESDDIIDYLEKNYS
jgi:glutaredoxin